MGIRAAASFLVALSGVVVILGAWGAGERAAAASTSQQFCSELVDSSVFSPKIQATDDPYTIRDTTDADIVSLKRVLRSQCMLDMQTLNANWDGKTEAEREAFFSNYSRVKRVVTSAVFDKIFPGRNAAYTLERFLKATAAFPYLCAEDGETDDTCKREFATMFAHWLQETSGLIYLNECSNNNCTKYLNTVNYLFTAASDLPNSDYRDGYSGRGPKQLSWNGNYGRFSWRFFKDMRLLEKPSLLTSSDGVGGPPSYVDPASTTKYIDVSFVSAFWFYMTPGSQKPSMHEMVTGIWQPNSVDQAANILPGFGATINVINGGIECGKGTDQNGSLNRIAFFKGGVAQGQPTNGTLAAFGLDPAAETNLSCKNQGLFGMGGAGSYPLYFNYSPWWQCELAYRESLFSAADLTPFSALGVEVCSGGYACCQRVRQQLKATGKDAVTMQLDQFVDFAKALGSGDGSTLVLQNQSTGQVGTRNASMASSATPPADSAHGISIIPSSNVDLLHWRPSGGGDFNGDGHNDLLWRNVNGQLYLWLMENNSIVTYMQIGGTNISSNWTVHGSGDFNKDGHIDIVWRRNDGLICIWYMSRLEFVTWGTLTPSYVGTNWRIAGVSDLNDDLYPDILWRSAYGQNYLWFMNGSIMTTYQPLQPSYVRPDWIAEGLCDQDHDGNADIVWRNQANNHLIIWCTNGASMTTWFTIEDVPSGWSLIGVGHQ